MVKKTIEEDFKCPINELFTEFEEKPVASASLAQVHRAKIIGKDGTQKEVAVKV